MGSNADVWNFEGPAPSWVSKAQTYKRDIPRPNWKQVYENSPLDMLTGLGVQNARRRSDVPREQGVVVPSDQVLGGEAMVYSYETDAESLQSTLWPRGAAHRERMVNRGTRAETFQPEYCF